jgi:hypothetical protein
MGVRPMLPCLLLVMAALAVPAPVASAAPESDAASIGILAQILVAPHAYWWDHTDLTVAVQASGGADPAYMPEIRGAIATWSSVLQQEFGGLITLTDVTDPGGHRADIVIKFVPHEGGLAFCCKARCQAGHCSNVSVSTIGPPGRVVGEPTSPETLGDLVLHELGHALGLGHAEPLLETTDVMGYGWIPDIGFPGVTPVISACDIKALRVVWAWAVEGANPHRPTVASVTCG